MSDSNKNVEVQGEWPLLENKILEELVIQEYWLRGKKEDEANIVHIKAGGIWYRLYFDHGVIFWRESEKDPSHFCPDSDAVHEYHLINFSKKLDVIGKSIQKCVGEALPGGALVTLQVGNTIIRFRNVFDTSTIEI